MNPSKPVAGIQLHYWCFSAVPGMDAVKSARSIIATSGTLTPLTAFTYELGLQFDILFSSDHVIKADQVWAGVFPKGRDGMQLQATFTNRNNPQYLRSLGECIVKLAQIIPQVRFETLFYVLLAID